MPVPDIAKVVDELAALLANEIVPEVLPAA